MSEKEKLLLELKKISEPDAKTCIMQYEIENILLALSHNIDPDNTWDLDAMSRASDKAWELSRRMLNACVHIIDKKLLTEKEILEVLNTLKCDTNYITSFPEISTTEASRF